MFFSIETGEFITYADGMDKKVQFRLSKIHRELLERTKPFSLPDLEDNFEQIYEEARSIFN